MNIVEREIAKREAKLQAVTDKIAKIEEYKTLIEQLQEEVNAVNVAELEEEIAEFKTFLPQPVEPETEVPEEETEEVEPEEEVATEEV
jgi:hypothetical protein